MIRPIEEKDKDGIVALFQDPELMKTYGMKAVSREREDQFFESLLTPYEFVVEVKGKIAGSIGLVDHSEKHERGEIAFVLAKDYWGKGLMKESLKSYISFIFRHAHLHRLEAYVMPFNEPSSKLLEGLGFTLEGHLRQRTKVGEKFHDYLIYGLLKDEWEQSR